MWRSALLEQFDQARRLRAPRGLLGAVARLADVLRDAPLDLQALADVRERSVEPRRDLAGPIDVRDVAPGRREILADELPPSWIVR